jgi:hypothetical protein
VIEDPASAVCFTILPTDLFSSRSLRDYESQNVPPKIRSFIVISLIIWRKFRCRASATHASFSSVNRANDIRLQIGYERGHGDAEQDQYFPPAGVPPGGSQRLPSRHVRQMVSTTRPNARSVARPYLESGQLTHVLTDRTAEQYPILVMYPKSRHLSRGAALRRLG